LDTVQRYVVALVTGDLVSGDIGSRTRTLTRFVRGQRLEVGAQSWTVSTHDPNLGGIG
jgi:hypothetical protein